MHRAGECVSELKNPIRSKSCNLFCPTPLPLHVRRIGNPPADEDLNILSVFVADCDHIQSRPSQNSVENSPNPTCRRIAQDGHGLISIAVKVDQAAWALQRDPRQFLCPCDWHRERKSSALVVGVSELRHGEGQREQHCPRFIYASE